MSVEKIWPGLPHGHIFTVSRENPKVAIPEARSHPESEKQPEVVVGVNGSRASLRAVSIAAREAQRRGFGLRLVYVVPELAGEPTRKTDAILFCATRVARFSVSGGRRLPLTALLVAGSPLAVLLAQAREAALLVVGAGSHDVAQPDIAQPDVTATQAAFEFVGADKSADLSADHSADHSAVDPAVNSAVASLGAQLRGLRTGPLLVVSARSSTRYYGPPTRLTDPAAPLPMRPSMSQ